MEYIYIKNYTKLSKNQKVRFLDSINKCDEFKISNQKILFCEEALILGLLKGSNMKIAYNYFKEFFKDIKDIKIDIVQKSFNKLNQTILTFIDTQKQIRV